MQIGYFAKLSIDVYDSNGPCRHVRQMIFQVGLIWHTCKQVLTPLTATTTSSYQPALQSLKDSAFLRRASRLNLFSLSFSSMNLLKKCLLTMVSSSIILRLTGRHFLNARLPRLSTSGRGQIRHEIQLNQCRRYSYATWIHQAHYPPPTDL